MNNKYNRRKKRRQTVRYIIKTLEDIYNAEEVYNSSLSNHPALEDQELESCDTLVQIDEAIDSLRSAY
jgi:hypothetical protein